MTGEIWLLLAPVRPVQRRLHELVDAVQRRMTTFE
jgi:hypothetical protein